MALASLGRRLANAIDRHRLTERGSRNLDLLRGLAALAVMLGHLRGLFFVSWGEVAAPSRPLAALYLFTSFGHDAVIVFFVLSGYFVAGSALRAIVGGTWQWRSYLTRRLTRLYIVLLPALALGAAFDLAGIAFFHGVGPYHGGGDYLAIEPLPVSLHLDAATFLANAAYLQEIIAPTFGSNGALWSLSYEFWFYVLFPCAALALWQGTGRGARLFFLVLFAAISFFVGATITGYFCIWLLGLVVIVAPPFRGRSGPWLAVAAAAAALALGVTLALRQVSSPFLADWVRGMAMLPLVYLLAHAGTGEGWRPSPLSLDRLARGMAGFSYTLYLVHLPVLVFIEAAVVKSGGGRWQPDLRHGALALGLAALVLLYAWALSRFTEARTHQLARYLLSLGQSPPRRPHA